MDPRLRVGDADREETVTALQGFVTDGYLTLDEFSQRSAAAYRAQTRQELARLTEDLPRPAGLARRDESTGGVASWLWSRPAVTVVVVIAAVLVAAVLLAAIVMSGGMGGMGGGMMH
jgi:hypothetical protein